MSNRFLKTGYFLLEGVNSFATVYYSYYLYFYLQETFGFGNKANLAVAALNGFVCMVAAWCGGKFGQRFGYFNALKIGFGVMAASLATGGALHTVTGQLAVMVFMVIGMCFTWPNLEALVSEFESPATLARTVGLYNVIWAAAGAAAYFVGGAMLEKLGQKSLFYVPATIDVLLLALAVGLERKRKENLLLIARANPESPGQAGQVPGRQRSGRFVRMAWLANPSAYIAINTLVAVIPGI